MFQAEQRFSVTREWSELESKYASLVESSEDAIYTKSLDGIIRSWNHGAEQIYGYSAEEIIGRNINILVPNDETEEAADFLTRIGRGEKVRHLERRRLRKDGTVIHVSLSISPVKDSRGRIVEACTIARDVTERKKVEAERLNYLKNLEVEVEKRTRELESEKNFVEALIGNMPGIVTVRNAEGRLLKWNREYERVTGYSAEELAKLLPADLVEIPESQNAEELFRQAWASGLSGREAMIKAKDGNRLPYLISAVIGTYAEQNVSIAIGIDISEMKKIEAQLINQNVFNEALIQNIPGILVIRDFERHILKWNKNLELLTGYGPEEIRNLPLTALAESVPGGVTRDTVEAKTKEGMDLMLEAYYIRKNGEKVPHLVHSLAVDYYGVPALMSIGFDISAQMQAKTELEAFSYSVSHDLRTPLRAIDGFSKVLMEKYAQSLDQEAVRYLTIIRSNTQNMGKLIDDLLSFSRIGKREFQYTRVDMEGMARTVFDEIHSSTPERAIEFLIKSAPPCAGDRDMLRIALTNLISNAVKYSGHREKAVIEFEGRADGNEITYSLRDNGVGFDMKYADKLFGVFQRLHSQAEFEGTGIGLALVKRVINRHGGKVWAESALDSGSVFYFTLFHEKGGANE